MIMGSTSGPSFTRKGQGNEVMARLYEVVLLFGRRPAPAPSLEDASPPRHLISYDDVEGEAGDWDSHPNHKPFTVLEPLLRYYTRPVDRVL